MRSIYVEVYRNLHRDLWTIRATSGPDRGRVIGYAKRLLIHDARLVVQSAGRARALREKRRNVHAFVRGDLVAVEALETVRQDNWPRTPLPYVGHQVVARGGLLRYNPYRAGYFTVRYPGKEDVPTARADVVLLGSSGQGLATHPQNPEDFAS